MTTYNPAKEMTHDELVQSIITCAHLYGWIVAGFRPARVGKDGKTWRTPVLADGAGFPDLVLLNYRRELGMVIECKTGKDYLRPEQVTWLASFNAAGIRNYIIRPADWLSGEVERLLKE